MDLTKDNIRALARKFPEEQIKRLKYMVEHLQRLPGTEASLTAAEVYFYELLTNMKAYGDQEGTNPFLDALQAIKHKEHARCQDRFVRITSRNQAVRLFKNKLQQTIAGWL